MTDDKGTISQTGQITFRRTLPGGIDKAWAFLTQSDKLKAWYGEGAIEARPGGRVSLMGGRIRGIVTQARAQERLTYSWNVHDPADPQDAVSAYPESYLSLSLADQAPQTVLTLLHLPVPERFQKQSAMGWHTFLDMIADGLKGGSLCREDYFSKNAALYGVDISKIER
ncbi:MAG TPA: SRPBCC domain-containing protein [Rhizomicrobium sp.]|jgi:uncharacterized protein YndB with AHSA1/START domain|nr:SRPBCC domain-containing protein [Rhizomicrobium sp.]